MTSNNTAFVDSENHPHATERTLKGNLGVFAIAFMVVAAAAPLGSIAANNPLGFMLGNGAGFPVAYLVVGILLYLLSVGLGAMSKRIARPGAFFSYISAGLGRIPGVAAGYMALFAYGLSQVGLFAYLGYQANALFQIPGLPWWAYSLLLIGIAAVLSYRNIAFSLKILTVILGLEVVVFVGLAIAVIAHGGAEGLSFDSFTPSAILSGNPSLGLMFAAVSFIGFESTAIYRAEARDPDRTIPKATYIAVFGVAAFYLVSAWVLVQAWGSSSIVEAAAADPASFLQLTAEKYLGSGYGTIVNVFVITSLFACALSFQNVVNRYMHALGNSWVLHANLGRIHPRHGSPSLAAVVNSSLLVIIIVVCAIAQLDPYTQLYTWSAAELVLGFFILLAATCLSVVWYFRGRWGAEGIWKTLIAPALGFVGIFFTFVVVLQNFPLVAGDVDSSGSPSWGLTSTLLVAVSCVTALLGAVVGWRLRRSSPARYQALVEELEVVAA